jgi:dTDP-4-dehydrorhamnose reductase
MKWLIVGGSGSVGHELLVRLSKHNKVSFTYKNNCLQVDGCDAYKLDLRRTEDALQLLERISPDIVVLTAAQPSVDWHEVEREAAYNINVVSTKAIAQKCAALGATIVYVSTAFVFPDVDRLFSEEDPPAPMNFYGATKLGGEIATTADPDHLIIRTDQIYGWALPGQKKSYVVRTLDKLANGKRVEACEDWRNSPTYVRDLADVIARLVENRKKGIYHVVGNSYLNRVDWAKRIAAIFEMDEGLIVSIKSATLNLPARRPNARISNAKIRNELGVQLRTVDEGLRDMINERRA